MDVETALAFADQLVVASTGEHLNDLQRTIFRESWQGKTFGQIAENNYCNESYAKQVGTQLWDLLSSALGETVGKRNFKGAIERHYNPPQDQDESTPQPPEVIITPSVSDPNFVGREKAFADLSQLISKGERLILLQAKGGVGKTTLARRYLQQQFGRYIEFSIAKETQNITSVESLVEEKLRQLGEEPGREFGVSLERLKVKLQTKRIGVLIDNLETALDEKGKFIEPHRNYPELLRVLADSQVQSVTLITSRENLGESSVRVCLYRLEGLDVDAWREYFSSRLTSPIPCEEDGSNALSEMHTAYGGNAKAMEILSSTIQLDYEGDLAAYWQANDGDLLIERELEDLVLSQFERLQQQDPDAYKLLCRLGCYRYQDVPTVPREGVLCLLWDVDKRRQQRVIKSLKDRSLVEFCKDEYWLHPVIRAEAIKRLRESEDWEKANVTAAEFWTESVKIVKGLKESRHALEAHYQYINISQIDKAISVLLHERNNDWEEGETLGDSLCRFGLSLVGEVTTNILAENTKIWFDDSENDYQKNYIKAHFLNLIGNIAWFQGNLKLAIQYQTQSQKLAKNLLEDNLKDEIAARLSALNLVTLFNIALSNLYLYELQISREIFSQLLLERQTHIERFSNLNFFVCLPSRCKSEDLHIDCYLCIALINAYLGDLEASREYFHKSNLSNECSDSWSKGYHPIIKGSIYKKLSQPNESKEMYKQAIQVAENSGFSQIKGEALTGLAELYRIKNEIKIAFGYHNESIKILDKLGAKCDLAEAYYQRGLTYQKLGDIVKSQEDFNQAIKLYQEMEAPRQVEKVQQAINNPI